MPYDVNNREINLYNFKDKDENGYYDISGKSIVKSLMKPQSMGQDSHHLLE